MQTALRARILVTAVALLILPAIASALGTRDSHAWSALTATNRKMLDELEHRTFDYFKDSSSTGNGLAADHWPKDNSGEYFASIAATGFALTSYGIGVERGWMTRAEAVRRTLATLEFFFQKRKTGRRVRRDGQPWFLSLPGR